MRMADARGPDERSEGNRESLRFGLITSKCNKVIRYDVRCSVGRRYIRANRDLVGLCDLGLVAGLIRVNARLDLVAEVANQSLQTREGWRAR